MMTDPSFRLSDCDMTLLDTNGLSIGRLVEWAKQFEEDTPLMFAVNGCYAQLQAEEEHGALVLVVKELSL